MGAPCRTRPFRCVEDRGILVVWSPPVGGFAALGLEGMVVLVSESEEKRPIFGRKRRPNVPEGRREKRYVVKVTAEEDAQLRARAEVRDVTVARLLFESAMDAKVVTAKERKEAVAMLFKLQREMANASNNVNQIARFANAEGRYVAEAVEVTAEYRRVAGLVSEALSVVNRT